MALTFRYNRLKVLGGLAFIVGSIAVAIWMSVMAMTEGATIRGHNASAFVVLVSVAWTALALTGLTAYAPCLFAPFAVRIEPGSLHVFAGWVGWRPRRVETKLRIPPGAILILYDYGVASETPLEGTREGRPCSTRGVVIIWRLVKDQAAARAAVEAMGRSAAA